MIRFSVISYMPACIKITRSAARRRIFINGYISKCRLVIRDTVVVTAVTKSIASRYRTVFIETFLPFLRVIRITRILAIVVARINKGYKK